MKFNINAPFWQFMNTLTRFTALNLVYLATLIPIVTIGPARAALYSTMFAYDEHDDIRLVHEYLQRFKREFKQGLISGIFTFVLAAAILFGLSFWNAWDTNASYAPLIFLIIAAVVVALFAEYVAPLQARFTNTLGRLWQLSAMFPWRAFPCSLILVVIDILAFGISYYVPFVRVFAILFGIAWVSYAKSLILLWGFNRYGGMGRIENPQYVNAHD
jgi:uncharacterized membrane protein YesL